MNLQRRQEKNKIIEQGAIDSLPVEKKPTVIEALAAKFYAGGPRSEQPKAEEVICQMEQGYEAYPLLLKSILLVAALATHGLHDAGIRNRREKKFFKAIVRKFKAQDGCLGYFSYGNTVDIAINRQGGWQLRQTYLHELTHFVMYEVFQNECSPCKINETSLETKLARISKNYEKEFGQRAPKAGDEYYHKQYFLYICTIFSSYPKSQWPSELASRLMEIISTPTGNQWAKENISDLYAFFKEDIYPNIIQYLADHQFYLYLNEPDQAQAIERVARGCNLSKPALDEPSAVTKLVRKLEVIEEIGNLQTLYQFLREDVSFNLIINYFEENDINQVISDCGDIERIEPILDRITLSLSAQKLKADDEVKDEVKMGCISKLGEIKDKFHIIKKLKALTDVFLALQDKYDRELEREPGSRWKVIKKYFCQQMINNLIKYRGGSSNFEDIVNATYKKVSNAGFENISDVTEGIIRKDMRTCLKILGVEELPLPSRFSCFTFCFFKPPIIPSKDDVAGNIQAIKNIVGEHYEGITESLQYVFRN